MRRGAEIEKGTRRDFEEASRREDDDARERKRCRYSARAPLEVAIFASQAGARDPHDLLFEF